MVEDVAALAVVVLVEVVHVLPAGGEHRHRTVADDQIHEIEEVAAFLDEGAAGVVAEPVPGPDLGQERKPMLADGDHVGLADRTALYLVEQGRNRRHVAILEADPGDGIAAGSRLDDVETLSGRDAHRLLGQHVQIGGQQIEEHGVVGVIRRRDDDRVAEPGLDQCSVIGEHLDAVAAGRHAAVA